MNARMVFFCPPSFCPCDQVRLQCRRLAGLAFLLSLGRMTMDRKRCIWLGGIACVALFWLEPGIGAAETYQVGIAKVDITPAYPIRLNGFGFRREESEGVSQRIWAKALAIGQADEPPVVLLTVDSLGVRLPMIEEVASRLHKEFGITRERVALTFSHSHCTPKVNGSCDNIFSSPIPTSHQEHIDRYTQELTEHLVTVAVAAVRDRKPATLEWNVGTVRFAKNRRTPGGPVDHDLPMLIARGENGEPRAIYVSYACHCVTLSFNQISGDWSGYAQELIERKFPGAVALVSIGCGSDSNPVSGVTGDKIDVATQQGAEIADEVGKLLSGPCRPLRGQLTARLEYIDLALNGPPTREQLQTLVKQAGPPGYNAQTQLARLDRGEKLLQAIRYPVQSFTFGDNLQMVFLAGEVCVDYSLRLKRELSKERLWLNGYSNDFCAYIPSERLVKEGGYGGGGEIPYFALPASLKPGLEQQIVDAVKRQTPEAFHAATATPGQPASDKTKTAKETQGVPPKSPAESMQCLQTHDSLRIELVAAEPLVSDPVAIDFGPDGKLWVVEMTDYARGVNDEFTPKGRVRFLTDTDDDGRFDQTTEFISDLRFPTDVKVWRDGVLICDAPDILFASDTDGDGRADVRRKLFSGFATHNPHARVNSLRNGLDNWVYGSGGLFGGKITTPSGQVVDVTNRDFRIHPDLGIIEPVTGQTQQGRPRDDWDNWFGCTNGSLLLHYAVDDHYARRNPLVAAPAPIVSVPDYPNSNRLYPRGDLVLFKLSGAPGRPTSACGVEIYRDELLGAEYTGNAFTCEPVNQLVHRLILTRKGATFSGRRAEQEADSEFLTSTDRWFRPVQARTGPDGALWIVDMYRYVIEHPQWIPPEVTADLNVFAGQGLGRIYRIVGRDQPAHRPLRLDRLHDAQLAAAIDSSNGIQRDLAQQMLVLRNATAATEPLAKVMLESRWPAARIQAAATLSGLQALKAAQIMPLLTDSVAEVRRHGIRFAERQLDQSPDLLMAALRLVNDPAVEVRLQLAYSLGECRDERAAAALATLGFEAAGDAYQTSAVLSSVGERNVVPVLRQVLTQVGNRTPEKWIQSLLAIAAATGDAKTVEAVIRQMTADPSPQRMTWCWPALGRVLDAADRRALALDSIVLPETKRQVVSIYAAGRQSLAAEATQESERIAALQLLGRSAGTATQSLVGQPSQQDAELIASHLATRFPPAVQSAAVAGLTKMTGKHPPQQLLARWPDATPRLRAEILDALLSRDEWLADLFGAIESGTVKAGDFDATRRQRLLTHKSEAIRRSAEKLLSTAGSSSRTELLARWRSVVTMVGDPEHGRIVFQKQCSGCHQLDGTGFQVGPDLAALTNRSAASILVAILDPNRDIDGRYVSYITALTDGRTISGLLVNEAGNSVTLREQGGKDHVLLRTDVEELRATGKSVMPEGLEKDVTQQDVADLIAYLLPSRVPSKSFAGNHPTLVTRDRHGAVSLLATNAEIYGDEIRFESESPFKNVGYWHGTADYVGWQVQTPQTAKYDVYFDYACPDDSAGDGFRLEGAEPVLRGVVVSTGGWSNYRLLKVGTVELSGGRSYLSVRDDGERKHSALLDLRGVYLVPVGSQPASSSTTPLVAATKTAVESPQTAAEIARMLLDDSRPNDARQKLIAEHPQQAAEIIAAMVASLPRDTKEEYRRIPWIWRVAIACGKQNQMEELREVLNVSMPLGGQPLRDWQAVVIGGGIINGVSQAGEWPKPRIEAAIKVEGLLVARWLRTVELAAAMADDEQIPTGTRYDALRMVAMGPWDLRGAQLRKYLAPAIHAELQMGAVSGTADVQHPQATAALVEGLGHYTDGNRELALDGLLRTPERCLALLSALERGGVKREQLGQKREQRLLEHVEPEVQTKAKHLLKR